jgi:hypothetical protein
VPARAAPRAASLLAAIAVATVVCGGGAAAEGLRTLHVEALTMRADSTAVPLGADVHLTIHVRVRERVAALDELIVPEVGTMHLLGDERHVRQGPGFTDIDETLTLEPVEAGATLIPGAYLDAIDGRTGKPTRFTANGVRIAVAAADDKAGGMLRRVALVLLGLLVATMGIVLAARTLQRRAPQRRAVAAARDPLPVLPAPSPRDAVREAFATYRRVPSRAALGRLRAALFAASGTRPGSTIRDAATATADAQLIVALRESEAAMFAAPGAREVGADELIETLEVWLQ